MYFAALFQKSVFKQIMGTIDTLLYIKQRRRRQRGRREIIGLISSTIVMHVRFNFGTFLCRPMQNNNVK